SGRRVADHHHHHGGQGGRRGNVRRVALCLIALTMFGVAHSPTASGSQVGDDTGPRPTGDVTSGTPSVTIAYDRSGRELARRTYRSAGGGPVWRCVFHAVRGTPGGTVEQDIDIARGPITPVEGDVVALTCFEGNGQVHQQIYVFDPAQPFGVIDAAA